MRNIVKFLSLFPILVSISSCSPEDDLVRSSKGVGWISNPAIEIEAHRKNNKTPNIEVGFGLSRSLRTFWEKQAVYYDVSEVKNGSYAILRKITDDDRVVVYSDVSFIEDFLTNDEYLVTITDLTGYDAWKTTFNYHYTDAFDFSNVSIEQGFIEYWIVYYDKDEQKPILQVKSGSTTIGFYGTVSFGFTYDGVDTVTFSNKF